VLRVKVALPAVLYGDGAVRLTLDIRVRPQLAWRAVDAVRKAAA